MEQRKIPFSRIRCERGRTLTAEAHKAGFLKNHEEPPYPDSARTGGIEGAVVLDLVVDREGSVQNVDVRSGDPILAEAAVRTVRGWKYRPTTVNGVAVEVATDIVVNFKLPDEVWSC